MGLVTGQRINFDFNTSFTEAQQHSGTIEYNYRPTDTTWLREPGKGGGAAANAVMTGTDTTTYVREQPGMSAFAIEDGVVYHTYSSYARGLDGLWVCTSGSTGRRKGATSRGRGSATETTTGRAPAAKPATSGIGVRCRRQRRESASRSACSTVIASRPAASWASRRRT